MSQDDDLFGTTSSKKITKTTLESIAAKPSGEAVDHPSHYNSGSIEVIDANTDGFPFVAVLFPPVPPEPTVTG